MELTILTDVRDLRTAGNFARTASNLVPTDATEVAAFCRRLTGLRGDTHADICDEVDERPNTSGYRCAATTASVRAPGSLAADAYGGCLPIGAEAE